MPNLSSFKNKYCEVVRVSYYKKFPRPRDGSKSKNHSLFKDHTIDLVYRSDGVILEKHTGMFHKNNVYVDYSWPTKTYGKEILGLNFGWRILGSTKESPAEFVKKYKAKGWTIKIKPAKVMSKYISKSKIRRLTSGL